MRMRRKKHLEERLENCKDNLLIYRSDDLRFDTKSFNDELLDLYEIFGNSNPIELEVGCGKGQFIVELAKQNPNINYIAVEKIENVVVLACERAKNEGVNNVYFISTHAEYLPRLIPENTIDAVYLNFSCPYPKNTYAVHRLTHERFLEIYKTLLKSRGVVYQKTDNMKLFEFSIEEFSKSNFVIKNVSLDLHNSGFNGNIETEYEHKFASQGLPIYRLEAYKKD